MPGDSELLGDMAGAVEGPASPDCPQCPLCASSAEYVGRLRATEKMKTRELHREGASFDSIYICPSTFACAKLATGATCCLVEAVLAGEVRLLWGGAPAPRRGPGGGREVARRELGRAWGEGNGEETPAPQRPCSRGSEPEGWGCGAGSP